MPKVKEVVIEPAKIYVGSIFKLKIKINKGLTYKELRETTYYKLKDKTYSTLKGDE